MFEQFMSVIRREIERSMRKVHKATRVGLVSSYDKVNHAVKVRIQPEGTETGWIPLTGVAVGNQFGIMSAPFPMDQVEVHFHEGQMMVGRIGTRFFSKEDAPPQIDPGEHLIIHQSGASTYFKADGTVIIGGASTNKTGKQGGGTSGNLTTGQSTGAADQTPPMKQTPQPNAQQTITLKPDGTMVISVPNNDMNVTVGPPQAQPWSGGGGKPTPASTSYNLTSDHQVNITATNKDVTVTAGKTKVNVAANQGINLSSSQGDINILASSGNINLPVPGGKVVIANGTKKVAMLGTVDTGGYMDIAALAAQALVQ
jgi:hypothetical protein